jgi:hypothetical protein
LTLSMVKRLIRQEVRGKREDDARKEKRRLKELARKAREKAKRSRHEEPSTTSRRDVDESISPFVDNHSAAYDAAPVPLALPAARAPSDARLVIAGMSTSIPHGELNWDSATPFGH